MIVVQIEKNRWRRLHPPSRTAEVAAKPIVVGSGTG